MDRFLRELEASIARLTPAQRLDSIASLKAIASCVPGLVALQGISKWSFLQVLGSLTVHLSGDRSPEEWIKKLAKRTTALNLPNVDALFRALS